MAATPFSFCDAHTRHEPSLSLHPSGGYVSPMLKVFKILVVVLLVVVSVIVQLSVQACAFRVTGNGEWYPVQLTAFVFDGMFILAVWLFLRRKPSFPAAVLFVFVSDVVLFFLALSARQAPNRFYDWFLPWPPPNHALQRTPLALAFLVLVWFCFRQGRR